MVREDGFNIKNKTGPIHQCLLIRYLSFSSNKITLINNGTVRYPNRAATEARAMDETVVNNVVKNNGSNRGGEGKGCRENENRNNLGAREVFC